MQNTPLNENPHCLLLAILLLKECGIKPTLILLMQPPVQGTWMKTSGEDPQHPAKAGPASRVSQPTGMGHATAKPGPWV